MAGAGYKLFATGDVLTAAQVNTYLMQQTVMVFASSAARTSALSGVLAEGMVSYLQDTNTLEVYDGSAWVGATGDITGLTAGTGISISSATGPVPTVTNSMATEITAKGDLIVGTGSGTFDNLAAGSNGETIVADSSTSTGLRYQGHTEAGKNFIINGGFDIWQRGTSFASSGTLGLYGADRWVYFRGSGVSAGTFSRQASGLTGFQYAMRVQRNSGDTSTQYLGLFYSGETSDSIKFAGKTVTLSFYARAGANYSAASSQLRAILSSGTGTDQPIYSYTGSVLDIDQNATLTTSWQRFSYNVTLSSSITELGVQFLATPVGTAGAADYFDVTGVQVELGSVATTFSRAGGTIQGELAACQRYYFRLVDGNNQCIINANAFSATDARGVASFPVEMRTAPTLTVTTGTDYYAFDRNGASDNINSLTIANATSRTALLYNSTEIASTAGQGGFFVSKNASASLAFNSEL